METLITRDERSSGATLSMIRFEKVALERGVEYYSSTMSWGSGPIKEIRLIHGDRLAYWKSLGSRGTFEGREEYIEVRKVPHEEIKSSFRESILSTIRNRGDIDINAVQKIYSNQEIRQHFPQLSRSLPSPQVEMMKNSNRQLIKSLGSGFYATDILSAMAHFNKAKTSGRYILPMMKPPHKMVIKAYISLAEGLVLLCQGLIENEKIFFEESMHKMDESLDIIPAVNYPLKLFLRAMLTEDKNYRRRKLDDARRISSEMISKNVTDLERDLTKFFLKYVGD